MNENKIGKRLSLLRKARSLTQCELAKIIGISQSALTDYERDKLRLHDSLIIKISQVLKISTDELLGIKNNYDIEAMPSLRLVRRMKEIEKLPLAQQKALLKNIDMFLKASRQEK